MAKVYRPKISPVFPKSAEFIQPPLEYTERKKDGVVTYEPKERKGKVDFHAEPPFTEGSAVTSASTFEALRDMFLSLLALQRLVSDDFGPEYAVPAAEPSRPFALPSPLPESDRRLVLDIFACPGVEGSTVGMDEGDGHFNWPKADGDNPSNGLKGWRYGVAGMLSCLSYHLCEGACVHGILGQDPSKYPNVGSLPFVPRLMRRDPVGKAFIDSSSRSGSGDWVPCLASNDLYDEELNPSPGGDFKPSEETPGGLVARAFTLDPGGEAVAGVLDGGYYSDLFLGEGYPLVKGPRFPPGSGAPSVQDFYDMSVAKFHSRFPTRALGMLFARFAKALGDVGCVFGGTRRAAVSPGRTSPFKAGSFGPVRTDNDGAYVGWPPKYVTVTGSESSSTPVTDSPGQLCFCNMYRPGSVVGENSPHKLGCYSEDTAEEEVAAAIAAESTFRDVPGDDAACIRAGDASVLSKCRGWEGLRLHGFLVATASYSTLGVRESSSEDCASDRIAKSDTATAYVPVTLAPSPSLTASDGSGLVVWLLDGSFADVREAALDTLTGPAGLRDAPHMSKEPPAVVTVFERDRETSPFCYYTEDPTLSSSFSLGSYLVCPHVVVPKGFFSASALDSSE